MTTQKNSHEGLRPVQISRLEEISPAVFLISFHRSGPFKPGQVIRIAASPDDPPRIYSICSGNREAEITVLFNVKPDGKLTPRLSRMKAGEEIYVSEPYGSFACDGYPVWWIATGTGLAPFYSTLQSGVEGKVRLVHGVSHLNQFYFEHELETALGEEYIRCCSRDTIPGKPYFQGRVTDYLQSLPDLPKADKYYLCGQSSMVVEVRDLLIQKGVPYHQIFAEIFF
ncbi:MAG: FAD-binding oxidoreductase [Marinilabiliales bacterium]|nr:FAD-binding oxidoreductase [Marinilabiliales bacterium]